MMERGEVQGQYDSYFDAAQKSPRCQNRKQHVCNCVSLYKELVIDSTAVRHIKLL